MHSFAAGTPHSIPKEAQHPGSTVERRPKCVAQTQRSMIDPVQPAKAQYEAGFPFAEHQQMLHNYGEKGSAVTGTYAQCRCGRSRTGRTVELEQTFGVTAGQSQPVREAGYPLSLAYPQYGRTPGLRTLSCCCPAHSRAMKTLSIQCVIGASAEALLRRWGCPTRRFTWRLLIERRHLEPGVTSLGECTMDHHTRQHACFAPFRNASPG